MGACRVVVDGSVDGGVAQGDGITVTAIYRVDRRMGVYLLDACGVRLVAHQLVVRYLGGGVVILGTCLCFLVVGVDKIARLIVALEGDEVWGHEGPCGALGTDTADIDGVGHRK